MVFLPALAGCLPERNRARFMKKARLFIALNLPDQIKAELVLVQKKLKKQNLNAKWVRPENLHLTLVFLGYLNLEKIPILKSILKKVVLQIKPIELELAGINGFPKLTKTRIVFVNLKGELGKLNALAFKIKKGLKKTKISFDEKPVKAHLTLARLKKPVDLTKTVNQIKVRKLKFNLKKVELIKSQLLPQGPVYQALICFRLHP